MISASPEKVGSRLQTAIWIVFGIVAAYGLWRVIATAWVCDDAFISFRYAKNLVAGHGLVFNVGETVEGYTNFLWVMLMAAGLWLGADPVRLSQVLGILCFAATVTILAYVSRRLWRSTDLPVIVLPVAAAAVLLQRDFHVYATSGMETSLATFLVILGYALLVFSGRPLSGLTAGLVLVAGGMTRPDALIFYVMGLGFILVADQSRWRRAAFYLLPAIVIYLPYWLWRYDYYGYPFPNTYYAKSAYLSYWPQGWLYIWLYLRSYYILWLVPVVGALAGYVCLRRLWKQRSIPDIVLRAMLLSVLFIVPFVLYVARVGGDFMFARFLIPITPLAFILLEAGICRFVPHTALRVALGAIIVAAILLRWDPFTEPTVGVEGIVDESAFYPTEMIEKARTDGANLKRCFEGLDVTVGFTGTRAMLMYYAECPVAIECAAGLTDEQIAHQEVEQRGRPGHEKHATDAYLRQRGVSFIFLATRSTFSTYDSLRQITFAGIPATIFTWNESVMNHLRKVRDVEFVDFPVYLDRYLEKIESVPVARRQADFNFFRLFYFNGNEDMDRLTRFVAKLQP